MSCINTLPRGEEAESAPHAHAGRIVERLRGAAGGVHAAEDLNLKCLRLGVAGFGVDMCAPPALVAAVRIAQRPLAAPRWFRRERPILAWSGVVPCCWLIVGSPALRG